MTSDEIQTNSSHRRGALALYMLFLVAFGLLFVCTTQRGPAWQDSGVFQERILDFDLSASRGIALAHPLMILFGKVLTYLPFGSIFWRMNLVSSLAGAVAVANVAVLVKRMLPSRLLPAVVAGLTFGLAHTAWWLATICESQMLNVALLTLNLNLLLSLYRRPDGVLAMLIGLIAGLGTATHDLTLLSLPAVGLMIVYLCFKGRLSWWSVWLVILGWAIGASGVLMLIVFKASQSGIMAAISSALFGERWATDVLHGSVRAAEWGPVYILVNFPNLALPLMVVGMLSMKKMLGGVLAGAMGLMTAMYFLFAIRYSVSDQFMFFLPFYAMVGVLAGLGVGRLTEGRQRRWLGAITVAMLLATPALYAAAPAIVRAFGVHLPGRTDLAFRDSSRYWLVPWKNNEDSAGQYARAALDQVPAGSTIVMDSTVYPAVDMIRRLEFPDKDVNLVGLEQYSSQQAIPVGTANVYLGSNEAGNCPEWMGQFASYRRPADKALFEVIWNQTASQSGPGIESKHE